MSAVRPFARARLVVLLSGDGTLLRALLDACASGELRAQLAAAISDRADAEGLEVARRSRVRAIVKIKPRLQEWREYETELADLVSSFQPDWVVLCGWARDPVFTLSARFPDRVLRSNPALPGVFPGPHAIERAYHAYCCGEIPQTGVTIERVPANEGDKPMPLRAEEVPISADDTLETLEERVHATEAALVIRVLHELNQVNPPGVERGIGE